MKRNRREYQDTTDRPIPGTGENSTRSKTLNAPSATIIFLGFLIFGLLATSLIEIPALGELLASITGGVAMVILAVILIPAHLREVGPNDAAWVRGHWESLINGFCVGCIIGICSFYWDVINRSHVAHNSQFVEPLIWTIVTPGAQPMLAVLALVLLGPTVEEMMFRGILYGGYRKSFGPRWALLITTAVFVAMHIPFYFQAPYRIVSYIVASLAFLWCRLHWNAIGPAIAAHSGLNGIAVVITLTLAWQHAFYKSGVADYKASNFNQAIASLTHAIQLGDRSSAVYIFRGLAKYAEGDLDGAISDYNKGIELNPKDSAGFYDRGLAKRRKEDLAGAIADYGEAITLNPKYTEAYANRGLAQSSEGTLDGAMSDFEMAIELNPTNSTYYNDRGWVEFLKGDFDSSIVDASRSIQLNPDFGYAYGTRGWARYQIGNVSGAVEDCKKATQLLKRNSVSYFHDQGMLDFIAKDYTQAIADWQNAIEQAPGLKKELLPWIEKAQKAAGVKP